MGVKEGGRESATFLSIMLQLKTTTVHIHNIFTLPTAVMKTHELIQQDRLLEAHKK